MAKRTNAKRKVKVSYLSLILQVLVVIGLLAGVVIAGKMSFDGRSNAATSTNQTVVVGPLGDTYVNSDYPKKNYGTQDQLVVDATNNRVSYVLFDLSAYSAQEVQKATFEFRVKSRSVKPSQVYAVTDTSWDETTLTYEKRPAFGSTVASFGPTVNNQVVGIDITSLVRQNLGKKFALAMKATTTDGTGIYSKESDFSPQVKVTFGTTTVPVTATPTSSPRPSTTPVVTSSPRPTSSISPTVSPTIRPTVYPTTYPTVLPTTYPTPSPISGVIGPISLSYRQGGLWLTPAEIAQIPMNNASWDSLVTFSKRPMDIVNEITCTAGGACSGDTLTPAAMYARAIVGLRTNNPTLISELRAELDKVEQAVNKAIDVDKSTDDKWVERNLGFIAVAANTIDYRPTSLRNGLRRALYTATFDGHTVHDIALVQLPNRPAYGKWSLLASAYLLEDWNTVNRVAQSHAKALGEPTWNGVANAQQLVLTSMGKSDAWQTLQPGGETNPLAVMPAGIYYQDHGVGGLYLADQYRAAYGPQWPPAYTDYIYEGMSPNVAVSWGLDHLGYKDVHAWGNYALLRALVFAYSSHDGKSSWPASGNDPWVVAAGMTVAKQKLGGTLPTFLKPESSAPITWPLPVSAGGAPGRGMGFMYATHYARLTP